MLRKKKIKSQNNSKVAYKIVVAIWLLLFLFVGIAYSSLASSVRMEGTLTFQSHIYDYVYITNVRINDSSGAASVNYSFMDHELNATIQATTCNSYVTYELDIVNRSPYLAYITNTSIASQINGSGNTTNTLSVDFLDVTPNVTTIPAHSTKTITVKIYNNCSGSDDQVNVKADFEYSLYKYFDLTVNASESDATVSITTQEGTFTGTGSLTHRVYEGETATFSASKKYFYTANGSYTMTAENHTENLTLEADPHRDLTINTNVNSATIVVTVNNETVCSGTGNLVCSIETPAEVTFTVDDPEYYYTSEAGSRYYNTIYYGYSETFTMTTQEVTKSITLIERPWITGTVINTNSQSIKNFKAFNYHSGYYLIEIWGGKGGEGDTANTTPGASGYLYGVLYIPYNEFINVDLGGNGETSKSEPSGGATTGGRGGKSSSGTSNNRGGGGAFSHFALNGARVNESSINDGYLKFLAGGGGGASAKGGTFNISNGGSGGAGGNFSTTRTTISTGVVFSGLSGTSDGNNNNTAGGGGSTTGGTAGTSAEDGQLWGGGAGYERGGGGGGGYYGGGGGGVSSIFATAPGGGGGGSSYIANDVVYENLPSSVTSKLVGTNPSSTGGAIIIKWIGKTM